MRIIGGSILRWLIFPTPYIICLPIYIKLLTLFVCLIGGLIGYLISNVSLFYLNKSINRYLISYFFGSIWFIPYISTYGIINFPLNLGRIVNKSFDQGWSEFLGGQNLFNRLIEISNWNFFFQNNNLKIYLLLFVLWIIFLFRFFLLFYSSSLNLEYNIEDVRVIK